MADETTEQKLARLGDLREETLHQAKDETVARRREEGKLTARERLEQLLDQVSDTAVDLGIAPYLDPLRLPTLSESCGEQMDGGAYPRDLWPGVVARTRDSAQEWIADRQEAR